MLVINIENNSQFIQYTFTMPWLAVFVWVLVIHTAVPYCGFQLLPSQLECPPEVLPSSPSPVSVVGLFSQVIQKLIANSAISVQSLKDLKLKYDQDLIDYLSDNGGPGFNDCAKRQFYLRKTNKFWQAIVDITGDLTWLMQEDFEDALEIFVKQFNLIINQPAVRSWLRELRDVIRIGRNEVLQAINRRRSQWDELEQQVRQHVKQMVHIDLCQNADALQDRFNRVVHISLAKFSDIISKLKSDTETIIENIIQRAFKLANKIYEVEISALKYFVS